MINNLPAFSPKYWTIKNLGLEIAYIFSQYHIMRSRIFKTLIAIIAPIAIEYIVKKISEKLDKKQDQNEKEPKQITA